MNIFFLHGDPKKAAQMMCDKHVIKMILETAQLLCTAHHVLDGDVENESFYKATHKNHPSSIWARESRQNYSWLYSHFIALADEYTFRYDKKHKSDIKLGMSLRKAPKNIQHGSFTTPPLVMPDKYKSNDVVKSYRDYYINEKASFAKWTKRNPPEWWPHNSETNEVVLNEQKNSNGEVYN